MHAKFITEHFAAKILKAFKINGLSSHKPNGNYFTLKILSKGNMCISVILAQRKKAAGGCIGLCRAPSLYPNYIRRVACG